MGAAAASPALAARPNGMTGIVGNALGLDALPSLEQVNQFFDASSLRKAGLLDQGRAPTPLLVLNGSEDHYVPRIDSTVFAEMASAEVLLVPGTTHCAAEKVRPSGADGDHLAAGQGFQTPSGLLLYSPLLHLSTSGFYLLGARLETRFGFALRNALDQKTNDAGLAGFDLPRLGRVFWLQVTQQF